MDKICPIMSKPVNFDDGVTKGEYVKTALCQQDKCMAWGRLYAKNKKGCKLIDKGGE